VIDMLVKTARLTALVVLAAGTLLWALPARCESVFSPGAATERTEAGGASLKLAEGATTRGTFAALSADAGQDTIEAFDVELEEEEQDRSLYKEIAMVAVAAGVVGYVVYLLIDPGGDDAPADDGNGKPIPFAVVPFSLGPRR